MVQVRRRRWSEKRRETRGEGRSGAPFVSSIVRLSPYIALPVALSIFLALALRQLTLPGLYYDEALDLVPMLQVMHGEPVDLLRGIGFTLGGYTYPVMLMDYMGSLNGYLNIPFMALLGPGVIAARIEPIFFSALTIVLAYALAQAWFGRGVASVTALLLAINPSFIWFSRQGISVTSVMTVFSLGSLLLINRWLRLEIRDWRFLLTDSGERIERIGDWRFEIGDSRSETGDSRTISNPKSSMALSTAHVNRQSKISNLQSPISDQSSIQNPISKIQNLPLIAAGLLLGLGLWAKLIFLWWIVALGAMALVWVAVSPGRITHKLALLLRASVWVLPGLLIGAAPLIYYNLHDLLSQPFDLRNAYTLGLLVQSIGQPTNYGVNNLDFWSNLQKAIADFDVFIDGSYFWYNGVPYSNVYAVPAFIIAVVVGSILAIVHREWHKWLALLAAIAVTVLVSAFTVSGLWATHLFIMLPLPQIVVAAAAVWLACWVTQEIRDWRLEISVNGFGERIERIRDRRSGIRDSRFEIGDSDANGAELRNEVAPSARQSKIQNPRPEISNLQSLISNLVAGIVVIAVLALPTWRDLWVNEQQHATLARTGGSGRFSDAIYKLTLHLETEHISAPIALDWGIEKSVRVLSADRVRPEEIFGFSAEPDDTFKQRVKELLRDPSRQYIVLWDRFAVYNRRKAFTQIANSMGMQVTETFIAHEQSGLPVYVMLQAK